MIEVVLLMYAGVVTLVAIEGMWRCRSLLEDIGRLREELVRMRELR